MKNQSQRQLDRDHRRCPACQRPLVYERRSRASAGSRATREVIAAACACGYRHARVLPLAPAL